MANPTAGPVSPWLISPAAVGWQPVMAECRARLGWVVLAYRLGESGGRVLVPAAPVDSGAMPAGHGPGPSGRCGAAVACDLG
jgi:hypothetical protein